MPFMKKHINFFLIIAIGLAFIILGMISFYYQSTFTEIISNYQSTKTTLKVCNTELKQCKDLSLKLNTTAQTTKQDVAKYGELYDEKIKELENKEDKLKSTETTLEQTERSLKETKGLYEAEKGKSNSLQIQLTDATHDIDDLKKKNSILKNDNAELSARLATCQASGGS